MPSLCVDITYLLTFGLASPLLAIVISFSIVMKTIIWRLSVGRYCFSAPVDYKYILETAFRDKWQCLSSSWWVMSIFIGIFWSFFIHDMIGARNTTGGAIGGTLMLIWCPLVFVCTQKLLSEATTSSYWSHIEIITLYIHNSTWRYILPFRKVSDSDEASDTNAQRISTICETVSPLADT